MKGLKHHKEQCDFQDVKTGTFTQITQLLHFQWKMKIRVFDFFSTAFFFLLEKKSLEIAFELNDQIVAKQHCKAIFKYGDIPTVGACKVHSSASDFFKDKSITLQNNYF